MYAIIVLHQSVDFIIEKRKEIFFTVENWEHTHCFLLSIVYKSIFVNRWNVILMSAVSIVIFVNNVHMRWRQAYWTIAQCTNSTVHKIFMHARIYATQCNQIILVLCLLRNANRTELISVKAKQKKTEERTNQNNSAWN